MVSRHHPSRALQPLPPSFQTFKRATFKHSSHLTSVFSFTSAHPVRDRNTLNSFPAKLLRTTFLGTEGWGRKGSCKNLSLYHYNLYATRNSPPACVLFFQRLPTVKFCNSFILITIQIARGWVGMPLSVLALKFYFMSLVTRRVFYPQNPRKSAAYKVPYILPSSVSSKSCVFTLFKKLPWCGGILLYLLAPSLEGLAPSLEGTEAKSPIRNTGAPAARRAGAGTFTFPFSVRRLPRREGPLPSFQFRFSSFQLRARPQRLSLFHFSIFRLPGHLRGGQFDGDGGAVGVEVLGVDFAVVFFHRAVAHAQAQAGALAHGLGGIERIEDAVEVAEAGSGVAEAHDNFPGVEVSFHQDFLFRRLLDSLRRVGEKIHENHFELAFVDGNARQVRRKVQFKTDARLLPLILAKHQRIPHHGSDVQGFPAVLQRARKTDQVINDALHAPRFRSQALELLLHAVFRGLFLQQVGVAHDRG